LRVVNAGPEQVFKAVVVLHLAFTGAVIVYIIVGEVMDWSDPEFDGYILTNDDGGTKLLLRIVFGVMAFIQFVLAFTWLSGSGYVERALQSISKRANREPDGSSAAAALQTRHIHRVATLESIAVSGLILYILGGERIDLYGFCAVSMVGLLLIWPRRSEWEESYRTLARKYPGIPSNPWHVELAAE